MSDIPRYWSEYFIDRYVEAMNNDAGFQSAVRRFKNTIVLRCLDAPDGQDIRAEYAFDNGTVSVDVWAEEAPSPPLRDEPFDDGEAMARATATYSVWTRLDKGEMSVVGAMASPDYSIEGSTFSIMMNIGVLNAMSELAASMEKTY